MDLKDLWWYGEYTVKLYIQDLQEMEIGINNHYSEFSYTDYKKWKYSVINHFKNKDNHVGIELEGLFNSFEMKYDPNIFTDIIAMMKDDIDKSEKCDDVQTKPNDTDCQTTVMSLDELISEGEFKIKPDLKYLQKIESIDSIRKHLNPFTTAKARAFYNFENWATKTKLYIQEHNPDKEAHFLELLSNLYESKFDFSVFANVISFLQTMNDKSNNVETKIIKMEKTNSKVFIVHGHDELMIAQLESFLRKLDLEPIILREQANEGQTIIEKLESNSNVKYAIVLYTACDFGCPKEDVKLANRLKPRARQNVVFEHGFFISKLGRKNVCALLEDGVEEPGDITGVLYIPIDKNGTWKLRVAKEMKNVGLNVDLNKLMR